MKLYKGFIEIDERELAQRALKLFLEDYAVDIVNDIIIWNVDTSEIPDDQIEKLKDEILLYLDNLELPN